MIDCNISQIKLHCFRIHWHVLIVLRIIQGLAGGFTIPLLFNVYDFWGTPYERATLVAMTFAGVALASILSSPMAAVMCYSNIDNGWPMIFYFQGKILAIMICILHYGKTAHTLI